MSAFYAHISIHIYVHIYVFMCVTQHMAYHRVLHATVIGVELDIITYVTKKVMFVEVKSWHPSENKPPPGMCRGTRYRGDGA